MKKPFYILLELDPVILLLDFLYLIKQNIVDYENLMGMFT